MLEQFKFASITTLTSFTFIIYLNNRNPKQVSETETNRKLCSINLREQFTISFHLKIRKTCVSVRVWIKWYYLASWMKVVWCTISFWRKGRWKRACMSNWALKKGLEKRTWLKKSVWVEKVRNDEWMEQDENEIWSEDWHRWRWRGWRKWRHSWRCCECWVRSENMVLANWYTYTLQYKQKNRTSPLQGKKISCIINFI